MGAAGAGVLGAAAATGEPGPFTAAMLALDVGEDADIEAAGDAGAAGDGAAAFSGVLIG